MKTRHFWIIGGAAAFGLTIAVWPGASVKAQDVQQQVQEPQVLQEQEPSTVVVPDVKQFTFSMDGDGASWLGVETQEVTAEKVKEFKLPAERGVFVSNVLGDSPAAKAGLKNNDVITEFNGQKIEGAAQFRRMIREIPAGRNVQLTVWRDGRAQTITATLGAAEDRHVKIMKAAPGAFAFRIPDIPEIAEVPDMEWNGLIAPGSRPRLGIDAEDLSGQLGSYFGVPDEEGVLVRSVNSGSPAEKAGLKAGDVITSVNGERIRSTGELREQLAKKRGEKTAKLGLLRNKSEISVTVELPQTAPKSRSVTVRRQTNI